eukprot:TRINITY_DN4267_c0_g1_i1.p1 TRINITY_DN4267_c0_g1~~TRINITY_DN4267_c0_g1_i1.p1  ORF type:complete len:151 (-),score=61.07 TRINITY_DN4267_c0_g1_i1:40-492(-)
MRVMADICHNSQTQEVDFNEFLEIMTKKMSEKEATEEILKSESLFDRDSKGYITFADLRQVTQELGEQLTDEEILDMLWVAVHDTVVDDDGMRCTPAHQLLADMKAGDGDGPHVSSENFVRAMKKSIEFGQQPLKFKITHATNAATNKLL